MRPFRACQDGRSFRQRFPMSCMHVRLSFSSVNSVTRVNYITHIENYAFYDNFLYLFFLSSSLTFIIVIPLQILEEMH